MDDLISRQAAIDAIETIGFDFSDSDLSEAELEEVCEAIGEVRQAWLQRIKRLPSAQPEPQWIPVSERLPEDYTDVLVWFEYFRYGDYNCLYQTYGIGDYDTEYDSWMINHETGWHKLRVIAWMPLPEPYRKEGEAE